jgi:short-subunit dehydrogenase
MMEGTVSMAAADGPRVALITGAASGIGRELARIFAAEGVAIAALDRNAEGLAALTAELEGQKRTIAWEVADVTDFPALAARTAALEERLGPVDLLIACAGIGVETSALSLSAADMSAVVQVNLIGVANSIAAVLPGMVERRRGHIAALSSLASFRGLPRLLGYCASKAGVNALLEGLRVELKSHSIHVSTICPGWIRTPMTADLKGKIPLMEVDQAARRIAAAIRRRRKFYAFPASAAWGLRLMRLLPNAVSDRLIGRMLRKLPKS